MFKNQKGLVGVVIVLVAITAMVGGAIWLVISRRQQPSTDTSSQTPAATDSNSGSVDPAAFDQEVTYQSGDRTLKGYLCKPEGTGPFPAVSYNHGGSEGMIGGAPEETCQALAAGGLVGFSPIRREELSFDANLGDVKAGVTYLKNLNYVDQGRFAIMGFSRGGLLTFVAASQSAEFKAVVIMASAPYEGSDLNDQAAKLSAPVLLQVASNDTPSKLNKGQNLVSEAKRLEAALKSAGKDVRLIIYPPYKDNGHTMFFEIGAYWQDVVNFLNQHLKS